MLKKLGLVMALVSVFALGVAAVSAAPITPSTPGGLPLFKDGRLNAYDAGAPIVVYEPQTTVPATQADGLPGTADVISGVQVLKWSGLTDSSSVAIDMSAADINKAIAAHPAKDFVLKTQNGVSLGYSQSGYFWVTSAPDFEGKTYTFTWQKDF